LDPLNWMDLRAEERVRVGLRRELQARPPQSGLIDLTSNDYLGLSRDPAVI
jgi:8-amino-7-oxononanoate synthase